MIGHLRGTLLEKSPNEVIVDIGGVGYQVTIPISTFTTLGKAGSTIALRIHTHVREDAIVLFGFASHEEKFVFERLIGVSGIGPKLAITVLSGLAAAELVASIRTGDVARLVRIPGVGKKTAERMVLELRDKLALSESPGGAPAIVAGPEMTVSPLEHDVLSALQNLGCSRPNAEEAIRKVRERDSPTEFEPFFRAALAMVR
jgi:holliday junction DNA helicase RuvA